MGLETNNWGGTLTFVPRLRLVSLFSEGLEMGGERKNTRGNVGRDD